MSSSNFVFCPNAFPSFFEARAPTSLHFRDLLADAALPSAILAFFKLLHHTVLPAQITHERTHLCSDLIKMDSKMTSSTKWRNTKRFSDTSTEKKGRGGSNGDEPCPNAAAQHYASKRCSQSFTAVSHSSRWSNRNAAATVPSVLVRREWEEKVSRNNNEVQKPESNVWFLAVLLCTECAGMLCAACVRDREGKKRLKVLAGTAAEIRSSSCMCEGPVQLHGHFFCLFSFLKLCYTFDEWLRLCICTVWCILSVSPQSFFPYLSLCLHFSLLTREANPAVWSENSVRLEPTD